MKGEVTMKVCIVGGVAGGAGAATRLRRLDEQAEIILFERGEHISYANCGLPYYLGGVIKEKESLLVTKPELLQDRFRIDVRSMQEVVSIDRENHKIVVEDKKTGRRYEETYDKLILSPGASPKKFPMEGIDEEGIFTVRSVTDTLEIEDYIKNHDSKSAMIIGGGFIGVEMAENLKNRGLEVSLAEFTDQIMAPLDKEMANILHGEMIDKGVQLFLGRGAKSFKRTESKQLDVTLTDGKVIGCDLVVLAMGVTPESHLAAEAGLDLSVGNSIAVNEQFQTSDPDIYAVGDAIAVTQGVSGVEALISLAGPANRQGRSAAASISGREDNNGRKAIGSSVVKVFDYTAASVGLNEKQLIHMERKYRKTYVHPQSHAVYYPGAMPLYLKMLFDDEGKILGAQAVGIENVEKQIDVLAAAIQLNGTIWDLERLELCYAPPFNSAKSPINMLGFTAANILSNDMPVWYAEDLEEIKAKGDAIVIDVSKEEEYLMGTIPYAVNMPLDSLRENLFRLEKNKRIYVTCRVGQRGYIAVRILLQNGYQAYNLSGGYKTYHTYAMDIDQLMEKQKKKNS
ncbi:MAG TPA: FAD-dependent oxidoreductase [Candidatus Pelethocola excrementipullorum]|nr:FAD-dependent oxidoreductase [Candidatus Pelethocola excrementipullorum]